jgi:hypothetical protein
MITTSAEPRRTRVLEFALVISLIVHVLLALIYVGLASRFFAQLHRVNEKPDRFVAITDVVRIEKRIVPRPAVPAPQPRTVPVPPQPAPRRAEPQRAAPPVVHAPPRVQPPRAERREIARLDPRAEPAPTSRASAAPGPPAPRAAQNGRYTEEQLAAINQSLANATARVKADPIRIDVPTTQTPATTRRYDTLMSGTLDELRNWQGIVEEAERCRGVRHCWFITATILWHDGYRERVSIPWPFYFSDDFDPVQAWKERGASTHFAAQPPPVGFQLQHPFYPSRFLCTFYKNECQALLDAEHRLGGPATN